MILGIFGEVSYNKETARKYRLRNRDRIRAYHKRYMQDYRHRDYVRKYQHDYYQRNGKVIRQRASDISRFKLYGVNSDDYKAMLVAQNHRCFICGSKAKGRFGLCVDHNHSTNEVRVLLCVGCNRLAGRVESIGWKNIKKYGDKFLT